MSEQEATATVEHNFDDADVMASEASLRNLLRALDDRGVVMDETQFRALSNEERVVVEEWVVLRANNNRRLVPQCVAQYASKELLEEREEHFQSQDQNRRILVRAKFNKPTAVLPTGDAEGDYIKMSAVIPSDDINRPSLAEDLFVGKRLKIEFSLRGVDQWHVLPGADDEFAEILECDTEIRGFNRLMKGRRISWKVSTDIIDDNTANRVYANQPGSLRITLLGDSPPKEKRQQAAKPEKAGGSQHDPLPGQQSLFNIPKPDDKETITLLGPDNKFSCPDEFLVPLKEEGAAAIVYVGKGPNGKFYVSSMFDFTDTDDDEYDNDLGPPVYIENGGYVTLQDAVIAEVGRLIEDSTKHLASARVTNELKDHLKYLTDGNKPIPVPEDDAE